MLIDEIKKANVEAMKARDSVAKNIIGIVMNKYMLIDIEKRATGGSASDADAVAVVQKTVKELLEEAENYLKVFNQKAHDEALYQKATIEKFLPKLMSDDEILAIINTLEDKSLPNVMKHFKANYAGKCDFKRVGEVLGSGK